MPKVSIRKIKESMRYEAPRKTVTRENSVSTGCTILNLGLTGKATCGVPKGKYVLLVGDSDSGKTWLCYTLLAEAAKREDMSEYRFIIDAPEDGAMMDVEYFFGKKTAERIESPPSGEDSATVQEFYYNLDDCVKDGRPFIYILDSENALGSDEDIEHFEKKKSRAQAGKTEEGGGSYGVSKAKYHANNLKRVRNQLRKNGSILIIISQTRDKIGFGAQYDPKTRSGGKALKFFADLEIWTAMKENITKAIKGKNRQIGIICQAKIKKNRATGKKRTVEFPIYHSVGIDDTGNMIDYLISEGVWKSGKVINAEQLGLSLPKEKLIREIEETNREKELRKVVQGTWNEIEQASIVQRKRRY